MHAVVERVVSERPRDWQLPGLSCEAVGGDVDHALPAAAAIACLQISIILIDDMLDEDPAGEHHRLGEPPTANLAAAFQAIALDLIAQSDFPRPDARLNILQTLNKAALTTAWGQYLDGQNPTDEAGYWRLVETKSGPFFGSALQVGALAGPATVTDVTVAQLKRLGELYGTMIQIHDDLGDALAQPPDSDWFLGRSPLPILFAKVVNHPDQARFLTLCDAMPDPEAIAEAQKILLRCGAVSYCIDRLVVNYQEAQDVLDGISLTRESGLRALLVDLVRPVEQLLAETIGFDGPVFSPLH